MNECDDSWYNLRLIISQRALVTKNIIQMDIRLKHLSSLQLFPILSTHKFARMRKFSCEMSQVRQRSLSTLLNNTKVFHTIININTRSYSRVECLGTTHSHNHYTEDLLYSKRNITMRQCR